MSEHVRECAALMRVSGGCEAPGRRIARSVAWAQQPKNNKPLFRGRTTQEA